MKRRPRQFLAEDGDGAPPPDAEAVLQIKVWLIGISPMVWRRLLVPAAFTLRELHGVIQVTMGWEGFHLFQFCLRAVRDGSWELSTSSPDVTLAALVLRKDERFICEYDLNIPWRHEVRIEDRLAPAAGKTYPICAAGNGACPPEDCGGPGAFVAHRNDILSLDSRDDLATMPRSSATSRGSAGWRSSTTRTRAGGWSGPSNAARRASVRRARRSRAVP
jgi:hypothetical protein